MSNLAKLEMRLIVAGNDLKMNIINHIPSLNKFVFNIRSSSPFYKEVSLPSNKDIHEIFIDFKDKQIIHCADYFPKYQRGTCNK
jgi:hypothetical protein